MYKLIFKIVLIILVIIIGCGGGSGTSTSSSSYGTAPYAIQHPNFNCDAFINSLGPVKTVNISWLWDTFGHSTHCIDRVLADPRFEAFQLHLINGVCLRNGNCGSYEVFSGYSLPQVRNLLNNRDPVLLDRIRAEAQSAANFLNTRGLMSRPCYISPILETDLTTEEFQPVLDVVKPLFPGCTMVFNTLVPQNRISGTLYEWHSFNSVVGGECVYNNDGYSVDVPGASKGFPRFMSLDHLKDQLLNNSTCDLSFIWHHSYNCINGGFVDPRARGCGDTASWNRLGTLLSEVE